MIVRTFASDVSSGISFGYEPYGLRNVPSACS